MCSCFGSSSSPGRGAVSASTYVKCVLSSTGHSLSGLGDMEREFLVLCISCIGILELQYADNDSGLLER